MFVGFFFYIFQVNYFTHLDIVPLFYLLFKVVLILNPYKRIMMDFLRSLLFEMTCRGCIHICLSICEMEKVTCHLLLCSAYSEGKNILLTKINLLRELAKKGIVST